MKCSLGISNFLEEISGLSHSIVFLYFFALPTEESFLISPYYSLEFCIHNKLWKILNEMGIPDDLTYLLRNLYEGQEAIVTTGHGTTDWFQIGKGVCQGCILSPCLFICRVHHEKCWAGECTSWNQDCQEKYQSPQIFRWHHLYGRRKQPRCPTADEWIIKLWDIYTREYYSAIKNAFQSVLMRWIKLEPIIQSEVSQKDKYQYSILTHIYGI